MLTLTDNARNFLGAALRQRGDDDCFRLVVGENGNVALVTGQPVSSDVLFEQNQTTVLAVDNELAESLADRTIDIEQNEAGARRLVLTGA